MSVIEVGRQAAANAMRGSMGIMAVMVMGFVGLVPIAALWFLFGVASSAFYSWGIWPIGAVLRLVEVLFCFGLAGGLLVWALMVVVAIV